MENQERQYFARPQPQNFIQQGPNGRLQYAPLGPLPNLPAPIQPMQQMQYFPISAPVMNPDLYETKKLRDKWAKWVKVASYLMLIVGVLDISVGVFTFATQDGQYKSHEFQMKISTCDIIVKAVADVALIFTAMLGLKASRKKDSASAKKYLRALIFLAIFLVIANLVYGYFLVNKVKGSRDYNEEPDYMEDKDEPYDENNLPYPSEPSNPEAPLDESFESRIQGSPIPPPDQAGNEGGEGSVPPQEEREDFPPPPEDSQTNPSGDNTHRPPCHKPPQNSNGEEPREHENRHHGGEDRERDHKKNRHHDEEGDEGNDKDEERREHESRHHQGEGHEDNKKKHHQNKERDEEEREHDNKKQKDHKKKHHKEENGEVDENSNQKEEHERNCNDRKEGKHHHKEGHNKGDREKGKHHQEEEISESESRQGEEHTEEHEIEENEEFDEGDEHHGRHHAFKSMIVSCVIINIISTLGLCGCYIGCAKKLLKNSKKFEVLASQQAPAPQSFIQPVMSQPAGVQMQQFNAVPMGSMQYPSFAPVGSVVNPN